MPTLIPPFSQVTYGDSRGKGLVFSSIKSLLEIFGYTRGMKTAFICNDSFNSHNLDKCLGQLYFYSAAQKVLYTQEVAQEVLAPQEHAGGEKKLNCALCTRSSKRKKLKILSGRNHKKL